MKSKYSSPGRVKFCFARVSEVRRSNPERALMLATLLRAMQDWALIVRGGDEEMFDKQDIYEEELRAWFLSRDEDYCYSFDRICDICGLNRKNILRQIGLYD